MKTICYVVDIFDIKGMITEYLLSVSRNKMYYYDFDRGNFSSWTWKTQCINEK